LSTLPQSLYRKRIMQYRGWYKVIRNITGARSMRFILRLGTLLVLAIALFATTAEFGEFRIGSGGAVVQAAVGDRLKIPAIKVNLRIVTARYYGDTWDFSGIIYQAAFLEGRSRPGSGGNVVIGAHSELARRAPGPFYNLDQLQPGDDIIVVHKGINYQYKVQ